MGQIAYQSKNRSKKWLNVSSYSTRKNTSILTTTEANSKSLPTNANPPVESSDKYVNELKIFAKFAALMAKKHSFLEEMTLLIPKKFKNTSELKNSILTEAYDKDVIIKEKDEKPVEQ